MSRVQRLELSSLPLKFILVLGLSVKSQLAASQGDNLDYTCYPARDYTDGNQCQTIQNGVCDDPLFGGSGGEACRNQDCIDCNIGCRQFDADCYGCLNAKGCYYCPGDGTCENSNMYTSSNKVVACKTQDFISNVLGDTPDACISDTAYFKDPQYEGSRWMYDAINIVDVWEKGLTGKGVTVRINDDGVFVDNKEFEGRFDAVENSCSVYLPNEGDMDGHGTGVAGILLANANNNLCGAGVAPEAKFSSCNFFAEGVPYSALSYKVETFDISQNSIGLPACGDIGLVGKSPELQFEEGCPFQYSESRFYPCNSCEGEFVPDAVLTQNCVNSIAKHCKDFWKLDDDACSDFPSISIGGSCDYDKLPKSAVTALEVGIRSGRDGKGTIFTFASGNEFFMGDDVNFSAWTNSRYTITVGAVGKDLLHGEYSTGGAALVVSAPGGAPEDYGHLMTAGIGTDTCADSGQGTSFACPVVTGVIALMLEANPDLSWRDVQGILATTSRNVDNDELDDTQTVNGAGLWHSNWYGFGIIDAKAAVEAAEGWVSFSEEIQAIGLSREENAVLSDDVGNEFVSKIRLNPDDDNYPDDFIVESTVVLLDLAHYNRGDLEIQLVSPSGTKSVLHPGKRPESSQLKGDERWKLMTVKNWGENPTGNWKLKVRDLVDRKPTPDDNIFRQWRIVVYGRSGGGKTGFGEGPVVEENPLPNQSELCKNPEKPSEGCILDEDGNFACPAGVIFSVGDIQQTVDAKIICSNDIISGMSIQPFEASQRGLCSCNAGLYDENCDVIEEDLGCQCFPCPEGSFLPVSYSCNKFITGDCKSFDCAGNCNGPYEPPLMENPATEEPTMNPTVSPTVAKVVTSQPTRTPTQSPTAPPTKKPTQSPTKVPTKAPTASPTKTPTKEPSNPPSAVENKVILNNDGDEKPVMEPVELPVLPSDEVLTEQSSCFSLENLPVITASGDNASCLNAAPISSNGVVAGSMGLSPLEGIGGSCVSGLETVGGWYEFTGNGNVFTLTASTPVASTDIGIAVFTGGCSNLECFENQSPQVVTCANGYATSWVTQSDQKYYVLVSGLPVGASPTSVSASRRRSLVEDGPIFELRFVDKELPENGVCGLSAPIAFGSTVDGINIGGESDTVYNTCEATESTGSWYTVSEGTVSENGVIVYEANTCNSRTNFYNSMSVFRGKCNELECVNVDVLPCDNNEYGQRVYWTTSTSEEFQVFVHAAHVFEGDTYSSGAFAMDVSYNARLANDQCSTAIDISLTNEIPPGSTKGVRPDIDSIENSSCRTGSPGAWYRIFGNGSTFQVSTCSSLTDHETSIQVYSGKCGRLNCIDKEDGAVESVCPDSKASAVNFKTERDVAYYILVTGRTANSEDSGIFGLTVTEIVPPLENECGKASLLSLESTATTGTTLQSTVDFRKDDICGVPLDTPGVWYTVEGNGKGLEISTCGSTDYSSAISIFKGTSCGDLECVTGTSATDSKCNNAGVTAAFRSESASTYFIYVHGNSDSPNKNMGNFELTTNEFDILENNEFCPEARSIKIDGSRIQGSTEDATHAAIQTSSCGVSITNPGLWYTFKGTGQPFTISACDEDLDDLDISVSVFKGNCDDLKCIAGGTFVDNTCTASQSRFLQPLTAGNSFRILTENLEDYYLFVHGQNGVGDFDLYVRNENLPLFGTAPPSATPNQYGKDLYRWTPVNYNTTIDTDYLSLTIIAPPLGTIQVRGNLITYSPPRDFSGKDVMTLDGCIQGDCFRFSVIVDVSGDEGDYARSQADGDGSISEDNEGGFNKHWLWLLLFLFVPCIIMSVYIIQWKRRKMQEGGSQYESAGSSYSEKDEFLDDDEYDDDGDDYDDNYGEEEAGGLLPNKNRGKYGSNRDEEDWESSDNEEDDESDEFSQEEDESSGSDSDSFDDEESFKYNS